MVRILYKIIETAKIEGVLLYKYVFLHFEKLEH